MTSAPATRSASVPAQRPSGPETVRKLIRTAEALRPPVALADRIVKARWRMLVRDQSHEAARLQPGRHLHAEDAQDMLAQVPAEVDLAGWAEELQPANGAFSEAQTRLLVALLVDSYPAGRPASPDTYVETLIAMAEEEGLSPAMVAETYRTLVRTARFLPVPAEFIAAAQEVAWPLRAALRSVDQAQVLRAWLEHVLEPRAVAPPRPGVQGTVRDRPPATETPWLNGPGGLAPPVPL